MTNEELAQEIDDILCEEIAELLCGWKGQNPDEKAWDIINIVRTHPPSELVEIDGNQVADSIASDDKRSMEDCLKWKTGT